MNIATVRGSEFFSTEVEQSEAGKLLESKGYQVAKCEHERMNGTVYSVTWRPLREKGTKWTNRIPKV